ncbi:hypothetical protein C0Q70_12452 [Pomacea canaliculata]|uniref:Ig-like domain-containing protein n=1 Tax=Pomacea canaliculata TaxID=400727 RepID=A0A2T7P1J6_POMCA|nr:hypothetical protein C0Q70_12452 [Pomacea canaliculata]
MDDTGRAQSSTTHGQGPLTLSLGQFRCQDVWPTIKCEAPESERNRSVVIFGKCPPQFLHTDTQVLALRRVLQEGLTLRLRSYTSDIKKCHMTRLSPQPAYIEVTCGLAGSAPEFNLTLRFTADSYIGEGIWMLHAITEAGSSNITFMIINNTSEFGNQGPAMTSGNKKLNTKLLVDCVWVDDELQCLTQEGFECKQPVSQIAEISLPSRFVNSSGTYKCIAGSGHGNVQSCQVGKRHQESQQEKKQEFIELENSNYPDDKGKSSLVPLYAAIGSTLGVIAVAAIILVLLVRRKIQRS